MFVKQSLVGVWLTLYEIAPLWLGSWWSGYHCWLSLVHCWVGVCSMWYGLPLSFHQPSQTATAHLSQPRVYLYDFSLWRRSCLQQDVWKAEANNPTTILPYLLKSECTIYIKSSQDVTQDIIVNVQSAAALCTVNSSRNSTQIYMRTIYISLPVKTRATPNTSSRVQKWYLINKHRT